MARVVRVIVCITLLAGISVSAQQTDGPLVGSGFISGRVVEGGTTRGVPGAVVTLNIIESSGPRGPGPQVIADAQGRFVFSRVPQGRFRVQASRPGWRPGAYGVDGPLQGLVGGRLFMLADGERAQVTVPVWRNALVTGVVTDDRGEPLAGAFVSAMRWTLVGSRRRLAGTGLTVTDDRGFFTLSVPPGELMIAATSDQVRTRSDPASGVLRRYVFRQTFYPDSADSSGATTLSLASGEERSGVGVQLSLQPAVRVTGVLNARDAGRLPPRIALDAQGEAVRQIPAQPIDPQGRFVFDNVPQGRYVVRTPASSPFPASDPATPGELWALAAVAVGNEDIDVSVDLHRKLLVSGRARFEGSSQDPAQLGLVATINLTRDDELPSDVSSPGVAASADGRFTVATTPGSLVVSAGMSPANPRAEAPPGSLAAARVWTLRSVTHAGRDITDRPLVVTSDLSDLELTFTDRAPALRGRVTSRDGSVESAWLLVFPVDETLWVDYGFGRRVRVTRVTGAGTFEFNPRPEGDYLIAAVRSTATDRELRNPAFLAELARRATRVTLGEGDAYEQNVEIVPTPRLDVGRAPSEVPFAAVDEALVRSRQTAAVSGGAVAAATVSGTVLAAGTNQPLAFARVGIAQNVIVGPAAYTDEQGRFTLAGIPSGQHTLYVSKPSYVSTEYGATRPGEPGTPLTVAAGQRIADVAIQMIRGAAIGGTVVDHNGEPMPNAQVDIRAYRWQARGRELIVARAQGGIGPPITNAKGEYRVYGLAPGDYLIQVTAQAGVPTAMPVTTAADVAAASGRGASTVTESVRVSHAPLFYPNTPDSARAEAVRLASGDDRRIDFQFDLIPTATVSGVVVTPDGQPPARLSVSLSPNDPLASQSVRSISAVVNEAGTFTVRGVPPGRYRLTTPAMFSATPGFSGSMDLFVAGDQTGLVLNVVPAGTVSGRVVAGVPAGGWQQLRVVLSSLTGGLNSSIGSAAIDAASRFTIGNVPPGRYRLELTGPGNVVKPRVASQVVAGRETIEAGIEVKGGDQIEADVAVTLSEAQVSGTVRDGAGQPSTVPFVVLFAREPTAWTPPSRRIFGVRPDQTGRYTFPDVPAGNYLIATIEDVETGEWFDPGLLARLADGASPLTVGAGDRLERDLTMR